MWTWRGVQISNMDDLLGTMSLIVRAGSKLDAMELIDDYASQLRSDGADDPYRLAQDNLGYLIGYLPRDDAREAYEFFELGHPMLGAEPWTLSDKEIVKRGIEWGESNGLATSVAGQRHSIPFPLFAASRNRP